MNDYRFGNFICKLRTEKGLSQSELGEMLGVTNKAVSKWENGSAKPNTSLIPKIAEIFEITVEELFACERIEKNDEIEKIQKYLSSQKKKFAVLFSIVLAVSVMLPLLIAEFFCVVAGFDIGDGVIAAIGLVLYIFAFVVSTTAMIIFYCVFRTIPSPSEHVYSKGLKRAVKIGILVSLISFARSFLLEFPLLVFIVAVTESKIVGFFLAIVALKFIVSLGVFVFLTSLRFLLRISLKREDKASKRVTDFSAYPTWCKIFLGISLSLLPIALNIWIIAIVFSDLFFLKFILIILYWVFLFPVLIYQIVNKKKTKKGAEDEKH